MKTPTPEIHKLIADVALLAEGRVLLVRYRDINRYDHQKGWFLPDDLLAPLEHPEAAACRVLREQLGLALSSLRLGHLESFKGNDGSWHLSFHYVAHLPKQPALQPSEDLEEATWSPLDGLPRRSQVAHCGWALDVIREIARSASEQEPKRGAGVKVHTS